MDYGVPVNKRLLSGSRDMNIDGLSPRFSDSLHRALGAMPPDLRSHLEINEGYRSTGYQAQLYNRYQHGGGLAAPPGKSRHNFGDAVDFSPVGGYGANYDRQKYQAALNWLYENGGQYGIENPANIRVRDPHHFQLAGPTQPSPAVGQRGITTYAGMAGGSPVAPQAQPQPAQGGTSMAVISPEWERKRMALGGPVPAGMAGGALPTKESDDRLASYATAMTQQPMGKGWEALSGMSGRIIGGMLLGQVRQNDMAREQRVSDAFTSMARPPMGMAGTPSTPLAPVAQPQPAPTSGTPPVLQSGYGRQSGSAPAGMAGPPTPAPEGQPQQQQPQTPLAPAANAQTTPPQQASDPRMDYLDQRRAALAPLLAMPETRQYAMQQMQQLEQERFQLMDPNIALGVEAKRAEIENMKSQTELRNRPEFTTIGHDAMGQPAYGFVDKRAGQVTPYQTPGSSSATAGQSSLSGDEYLKTLPPEIANQVKAYAEGRIALPAGAALKQPFWINMLNHVTQYDPSFDAGNYNARAAQRKNYMGGGKQFQELQAIGTVAGHLHDLMQTADKLDNYGGPMSGPVNWAANKWREYNQDPRVTDFNVVKQAVTNELSKAYRGGQVTEGDVQEWQSNVSAAQSPQQLRTVVGRLNKLLMSKRQALEEGYKSTMGKMPLPEEFSTVNDRTRGLFGDIEKWSGMGGDGGPVKVTSPAEAMMLPPGTQFVTPDGEVRTRH